MKLLLILAALAFPAFAGQGLDLSTVRADGAGCPAQTHGGVSTLEIEISNITTERDNDIVVISQCTGFFIDYTTSSAVVNLRLNDNWGTGGNVCLMPTNLFANGYIYAQAVRDSAGTLGPAKTDYFFGWDINGIVQVACSFTWTADIPSYNFGAAYQAQNSNATVERIHFFRAAMTAPAAIPIATACAVPCQFRAPATADAGPSNVGAWLYHYKNDGNLNDSSGNGYTMVMDDASTPNGTCGTTATSYCATLYQIAISIITNSSGTWKQGTNYIITGANSYTQADTGPGIAVYAWTLNSGPGGGSFSNPAIANPTMTSIVAGDYNVTLAVTDAASNMASATTDVGAVQVNSNDVVINSWASAYSTILTGTRLRYGSSSSIVPQLDIVDLDNYQFRATQFATPTGGASPFNSAVAYFDYAQAGTCTFTQYSSVLTCSGSSLLTTACNASATGVSAVAWDSIYAGSNTSPSQSNTYTLTSSNNKMLIAIDGGAAVTITLTTGSRTPAQIVTDINSALSGTYATVDGNDGLLIRIQSMTTGSGSSVAIQTIANSAYSTLGFTAGTFNYTNTPVSSMQIIAWYANGSGQSSPYNTGRRALNVLQCLTNTSAIVQQLNGFGWRLPTATGIQYSLDYQAWPSYLDSNNNQNYYSLDLADFALAAGDGLTAHKAQAEARAQRWARSPLNDLGQELQTSGDGTAFIGSGQNRASRLVDLAGPMFWTLEAAASLPASWLWSNLFELQCTADAAKWQQVPGGVLADEYVDQREAGFSLQRIALCALYDPNTSFRTTALGYLHTNVLPVVSVSEDTTFTYPEYPVLYWTQASWVSGNSVCVVNGSSTVTFSSSTLSGTYGAGSSIWFFPTPGTRPANNTIGDAVAYTFTMSDATHATLGTAYAGTSGCTGTSGANKGYDLFNASNDVPYVGWGAQPFMEGILGQGFAWAYEASLTDGINTGDRVTWKAALQVVATWMINRGEDYATMPRPYGVFQGADFVNCAYPITATVCFGSSPEGERIIMQEVLGAESLAWQYSGTAAYALWLNTIYHGMWTTPSISFPNYLPPSGGWYTGVPKYYGDLAGISGQLAWPGVNAMIVPGGTTINGNVKVSGNVSVQ